VSCEPASADDWPEAYRQVRFRLAAPVPEWPAAFVIITAWATTGETWPRARNDAADAALRARLEAQSPWLHRLTGYSPASGHAEPGWAAIIDEPRASEVGREFLQDAVYAVRADALWLLRCRDGASLYVGPFAPRVDPL
jgi:hypothetical protein